MQAVVVHGPEDYRLEEVDVPSPGPGELLMQVEAVGVCASDLKCYTARRSSGATRTARPGPRPASPRATSSSASSSPVTRPARAPPGRPRRPDRLRADRPVRAVPLLPARPVLDVRPARHVRLPQLRRRDGPVHAGAHPGPRAPGLARARAAARRVRRAAVLRAARGRARHHLLRRRGRRGRLRPDRAGPDRGARAKNPRVLVALDLDDDKLELAAAAARRHGQHRPRGRRRPGEGDDRGLRRGRLPGGLGRGPGRRPGAEPAAQAGHLRRVLGVRLGRHGRLVDHLRRQGARRPGRAPGTALLARRDQDAGGREAPGRRHLHPPGGSPPISRRPSTWSATPPARRSGLDPAERLTPRDRQPRRPGAER
ncbi:hypothetical protein L7F22_000424 [Adiantum nelumboides]|nr:hypothetical protein [Adiantum nelumboides]